MRIDTFKKEKEVVDLNAPDTTSLQELYDAYTLYTKVESDAKKKKAEIKKQLEEYFESKGVKDSVGNIWLDTPSGSFKKQQRVTVDVNEELASQVLKRLDLYDKVVSYEPVFDVDVIQGFIADGVISDEDANKIFERKITYALTTQKKKKAEEKSE
mgnify:CR=1 FL=1